MRARSFENIKVFSEKDLANFFEYCAGLHDTLPETRVPSLRCYSNGPSFPRLHVFKVPMSLMCGLPSWFHTLPAVGWGSQPSAKGGVEGPISAFLFVIGACLSVSVFDISMQHFDMSGNFQLFRALAGRRRMFWTSAPRRSTTIANGRERLPL